MLFLAFIWVPRGFLYRVIGRKDLWVSFSCTLLKYDDDNLDDFRDFHEKEGFGFSFPGQRNHSVSENLVVESEREENINKTEGTIQLLDIRIFADELILDGRTKGWECSLVILK